MEEKDIFRFEDFLGGDKIEELKKMKLNLLKEGLFSDEDTQLSDDHIDDDVIDQNFNPYKIDNSEVIEDVYIENDDESLIESFNDDFYVLYKDKSEEFVCDIAIEGVSQKDTEVRLIIESEDWNLMFIGEIRNGKCVIPVKKLNILNEGQTGNIKLEVNADGNLFTPWEDRFIVKSSKKVTVKLNENKKSPIKKETGVKVQVNKKRP